MILDVIQVSKDLFSASFEIKRENTQIGNFSLQGRLGSMEAEIQGTIHEQTFKMVYGKMDNLEVDHPFRPYLIYKEIPLTELFIKLNSLVDYSKNLIIIK